MDGPSYGTDARESLNAHVAARGEELRKRYGPSIGWSDLMSMLADRTCVRYPCEIVYSDAPLMPGEMGHPIARTDRPEDGFVLYIHPFFRRRLKDVPLVALYQFVVVNYGDFASTDDAETFGAAVLGLSKDEYYRRLCEAADALAGYEATRFIAND